MFRLFSHSTSSVGGCLTTVFVGLAALFTVEWLLGAVSALPPVALAAVVLVAVGVMFLPSPWRAVAVVAAVVGVLVVPAVPFALLAIVLPAAWLGRRFGAHIRPRSRGAHFAARWKLIWEGFLWHRWEALLAERGWPIGGLGAGFTVCLPADRECEGVIAVAPVPAILSEADRPATDLNSLVIGDPKSEITRLTLATLAQTHRPLVWDPGDPAGCTVSFDPLSTLPHPTSDPSFLDDVRDLADSWFWATRRGEQTTDPFFITQPRSLMRAAILTFIHRYPGDGWVDLADWIRSLTFDELLACVEHSLSPEVRAFSGAMRALQMNDRAVGGIWADVVQRFDLLDGPHIRAAMDGRNPPIDWDQFVAQPTALYLKVPAREAERLGPLLSLFLARMYRALTTIAAREPENTLPRGVRVIIDEWGSLSRIYGLENALATLRSAGIGHYLFVQTTAQIRYHYGRDLAQSITDTLVTKVILGGAADEDAKWFSARCGERTTYHPTTSHSTGLFRGSTNFGHAPERAPLVTAAEIIHMRDTVLLSTRGLPPVRCRLRPYYREPRLTARLEADARQWSITNRGGPLAAAARPLPSPTASAPSAPPPPWSVANWDDV